ncbi:MAG: hypothetical protein V2A61_01865 [Calditrichota bacterium]
MKKNYPKDHVFIEWGFICLIILALFNGCGDPTRGAIIGKWTSTHVQVDRWDKGNISPEDAKVYEFFEDGTGYLRQNETTQLIHWSIGTSTLKIRDAVDDVVEYHYILRGNKLALSYGEDGNAVIYERFPPSGVQ